MKKCKFCDHLGHTEKGEKVCTKHLVCLEDLEEHYCSDLEISIDTRHVVFVLLMVFLLVFVVIVSQI